MGSLLEQSRNPDIRIFRTGVITIRARVVRELGIEPGDVIDVRHDENGEYYLYIRERKENVVGSHKMTCRNAKKGCNYMRANSSELSKKILDILGEEKRAEIMTGETIAHPIVGKAVTLIMQKK